MSSPESENPSVTEKIGNAARSATEKVKAGASQAASRTAEAASEIAGEQRDHVADRIQGVGNALHQTAESTRPTDPNIAWLTDQAAERLQRAASFVRGCSWSSLRDEGMILARRHPVAFFGGMFALGALAGALIKAGTQASKESTEFAGPEPSGGEFVENFGSTGRDAFSRPETF